MSRCGLGAGLLLILAACQTGATRRLDQFPRTVLWAWERRDDLRSITAADTGVAFLALSIGLRGERALLRPRLQPLLVPDGTRLMAVVRIDTDPVPPPRLSDAQQREVVAAILRVAQRSGVAAVQIDFDATASQRSFYQRLLRQLRRELPSTIPISITALASWCIADDWISRLPIDEAVPMMFRLGVDRDQVRNFLESGRDFRPSVCRSSMGVSTDEMPDRLPVGKRVYIFHPQAWSKESVAEAIARRKQP